MLTIADIARRIGRDYSVVYTWFRRGKLPPATVAEGRVRLWSESDIDAWWENCHRFGVDSPSRNRFDNTAGGIDQEEEAVTVAVEQRLWSQSALAKRFGKSIATVAGVISSDLIPDFRTAEGIPLFSDDCVERAIANSPRLQKWQREAEEKKAEG